MYIAIKLETDLKQKVYWCAKLIEDRNCLMQVLSLAFEPRDKFNKWKEYEKCSNRIAKEIMKQGGATEQLVITQMLLKPEDFHNN